MIAQKSSIPQNIPAMSRFAKALLLLFVALQFADLATTLYGIAHGQTEHNDLLAGASRHIGMTTSIVIAKLLCILGGFYFFRAFGKTTVAVALTVANAFYLYIAIGNVQAIING
jgi:hypothetical protein